MAGPGGVLGTTRNRTDLFLRYRNQALGINRYGADNSKDASRCCSTHDTVRTAGLIGHESAPSLSPCKLHLLHRSA